MPEGNFRPGERVPTTGIYTATHYQHRLPHQVFAVEGDQFPMCRRCGGRARFALLQAASYIETDRDFSKGSKSVKVSKAHAGHRRSR